MAAIFTQIFIWYFRAHGEKHQPCRKMTAAAQVLNLCVAWWNEARRQGTITHESATHDHHWKRRYITNLKQKTRRQINMRKGRTKWRKRIETRHWYKNLKNQHSLLFDSHFWIENARKTKKKERNTMTQQRNNRTLNKRRPMSSICLG